MIHRDGYQARLSLLLERSPVVAILGARQVGKTTLARQYASQVRGEVTRYDLEDPRDLARLEEPTLELEKASGLVILDEIQRRPDLFPVLRVLVDRPDSRVRFLVLGSAAPELLRQSSESLAGRIAFLELSGFDLCEVGSESWSELWLRGGFPRAFLSSDDAASLDWRRDFIRTFLERDIPQLGYQIPANTLRRFWAMLAHSHGQIWNSAEFARNFGVSEATVRRYLGILEATFVIRRLSPWHENIAKRQVKSPKIYLADCGLLHALLDIETPDHLDVHPRVGSSWEGFALETVARRLQARREQCYFWATHGGAELDLLVVHGGQRLGFEFKRTDAPRTTRSMHSALETLGIDSIEVVHAGRETWRLSERIRAVALEHVLRELTPLGR